MIITKSMMFIILIQKCIYLFCILSFILFLVPTIHYAYGNEDKCQGTNDGINNTTEVEKEPFKFQSSIKGTDDFDKNAQLDITLQGNLEKLKPEISLNAEKLIITKYYGVENPTVSFLAESSNKTIPQIIDVVPSEFFISGKTISSIASDQIDVMITSEYIKENEGCRIRITDTTVPESFGKYTGKFTIFAEGFEAKQIDVEYQIQWHPKWLLFFTGLGVTFSIILGILLIRFDKQKEDRETLKTRERLLEHLNVHVIQLNSLEEQKGKNHFIKSYHNAQLKWMKGAISDSKLYISKLPTDRLKEILEHYEHQLRKDANTQMKEKITKFLVIKYSHKSKSTHKLA